MSTKTRRPAIPRSVASDKGATDEMVTQAEPVETKPETSPNGVVHGYFPAARWRRVERTEDGDSGTGEPFWAEIRCNLTFGEIDELYELRLYADVWKAIAPHIRAWNALGLDKETGTMAPVPPPAEGGPQMFAALNSDVVDWLLLKVRTAHLGDENQGKGATEPDTLDDSIDDDDSG